MSKFIKISIITSIFFGLILFGISKYNTGKAHRKNFHIVNSGNMLIGGMKNGKEKIESFKASLEEDSFKKFWDQLNLSNQYRRKGDYANAIKLRKEALKLARGKGDEFQVRMGLAKLYEATKEYGLALEEYDWLLDYSDRSDVVEELNESRKRIERLKAEASIGE